MGNSTCACCSSEFPVEAGRRGRPRIYCSDSCSRQAYRDRKSASRQAERSSLAKPCEHCKGPIEVKVRGSIPRFCSRFCQGVAAGNLLAEPYAVKTCLLDGCGATFTPKKSDQRCCCEQHGKSYWRQSNPRKPDRMTDARRANLRRKTQRRRARLKGDAEAESIDRDEIAVRDGWRCGLCSQVIDKSLAWPHPRSASLDHIEPLSLGGKHSKANVQISHLNCNVAKGNRGGGEQLLLIG